MKKWLLTLLFVVAFPLYASPVNINTASAEEIAAALKGIGSVRAQAIVDYRTKNGHFKVVEDIMNVKGINQKIVEKNRKDILLN